MKPDHWNYFETYNERCLLELDQARSTGRFIAGVYCIFAPVELIRAAGGISVGLCGKKQDPIARAEEELPANLCPLIKSSYGYAASDTCPYFAASDVIVGETTCDGKKKMFELLGRIKPLHMMYLPSNMEAPHALHFWRKELERFQVFLEDRFGKAITPEALVRQIHLTNRIQEEFQRLIEHHRSGRLPVSGGELLVVLETRGFIVDPEAFLHQLEVLNAEVEALPIMEAAASRPRILLTGTPVGKGSDKVIRILENAGTIVIVQENCTGMKSLYYPIDEAIAETDPMQALAMRYLQLPCSCMSPNPNRFRLLEDFIRDFDIQGVVDMTWQCCHTYNIEAFSVKRHIEERFHIPVLHLETDYSTSDIGQLETRIEAFVERIRSA